MKNNYKPGSRGFLYYAHNNELINYIRLAICSALSGRYHLKEWHATLVTDKYSLEFSSEEDRNLVYDLFENVIVTEEVFLKENQRVIMDKYENRGRQKWHNRTRPNAYRDSPYEETILIDSDFIIQNNHLDKLWGSNSNVMMNRDFIPLMSRSYAKKYKMLTSESVSEFTIPLYWATLVYFNRTEYAQQFFDIINFVHDNYTYYCLLYQIDNNMYRNDHSFSIAIHIMNGFRYQAGEAELPFDYVLATTMDDLYRVDKSSCKFIGYTRNYKSPWHMTNISNLNYHCMNKVSMLTKYEQFLAVYGGK